MKGNLSTTVQGLIGRSLRKELKRNNSILARKGVEQMEQNCREKCSDLGRVCKYGTSLGTTLELSNKHIHIIAYISFFHVHIKHEKKYSRKGIRTWKRCVGVIAQ